MRIHYGSVKGSSTWLMTSKLVLVLGILVGVYIINRRYAITVELAARASLTYC